MYYKMDYETFQDEIQKQVKEGMEGKGNFTFSLYRANKNNATKIGLTISERGKTISPTVYLSDYYMDYLLGTPLSEISREITEFALGHQMPEVSTAEVPYYEKVKDKLRIRLVELEGNRAYLEEGIYRPHLMGAEVVYLELTRNQEGICAVRVTSALLERWGMPENEVFKTALKNSWEKSELQFCSIEAEADRILGTGTPEEEFIKKNELYVITNPERDYGAAVVLYPGAMEEIRAKMGRDFYILPSSVHEVLVMTRDSDFTPKELRDMVRDVNRTQVEPELRLGNEVYEYLGETGTLQKCKIAEKERER